MKRCLFFVAIVFAAALTPARAHDHEHPELTPWYPSLHSGKGMCCDGSDAKHLTDVEWRSNDNHYQVFLEGDWRDVPDNAVVDGPNLSGTTLVWPYYLNGQEIGIRCFMPGAGT